MKKQLIPLTALAVALLTGNVYAHGNDRTHHHGRHHRDHWSGHHDHFDGFGRDELRFRVFHFGWPGIYLDRHHDYRERERHHRHGDHHRRQHDRDDSRHHRRH